MQYSDKTLMWGAVRTILTFSLLVIVSTLVFGGIGYEFTQKTFTETDPNGIRWLQLSISTGMFLMPPLFLAQWASNQPALFLGFRQIPTYPSIFTKKHSVKWPKWIVWPALILLSISGFLVTNFFSYLNHSLPIPPSVLIPLQNQENLSAEILTKLLANMTPTDLLFNFLVMVLLPAFAEELFFRGILQKLLQRSINHRSAILLTAVAFALVHGQPLSFLPLFFMGALLGASKLWTGSLWTPILLHLINNLAALLTAYNQNGYQSTPPTSQPLWSLIGLALLLTSAWLLRTLRKQYA